jgi:hypothetical protein
MSGHQGRRSASPPVDARRSRLTFALPDNFPTQAKTRLEWATHPFPLPARQKAIVGASPRRIRPTYSGFPVEVVALANFMRLSLMKAAHAVVFGAAQQEIRIRWGERGAPVLNHRR